MTLVVDILMHKLLIHILRFQSLFTATRGPFLSLLFFYQLAYWQGRCHNIQPQIPLSVLDSSWQ